MTYGLRTWSTLVQVMACWLSAPSHYLYQHWGIINEEKLESEPHLPGATELTHWGWATHICDSKLSTIGSDNGLLPGWCQAIIWTNAGILSIGTLGKIQWKLKVLLQWNSTSVYTSCTYSTYHLELALGTFICHFISACLVCHTS